MWSPRTDRPIDDKTLRRHFRSELESGYVKANAKVAQSLYQQATGGGDWTKAVPSCAIWWSKTRMGWKETSVNEHTGKDGGPIETMMVTDADRVKALTAFLARTRLQEKTA